LAHQTARNLKGSRVINTVSADTHHHNRR
jgi:hypothetical protein